MEAPAWSKTWYPAPMPALLRPWSNSSSHVLLPSTNVVGPSLAGAHQMGLAGGSAPSGVSDDQQLPDPWAAATPTTAMDAIAVNERMSGRTARCIGWLLW